ncbi:DUF4232 domain-containing protein [Streptomyces lancefieldiae]|uniref:DUF4232 domain-containing protein n=1 Tax=Streptomyces lancefieldiae TaxID=3075520 RepID=A0ABU3AHZ5_9ACTN|nr:DUF4232 domain-containing protein [Streptomyces sp. DSM 40712]MDT0609799.1 DUF4232 domain-containing protein [Streptomyces sp. DSM 40712]
MRIPQLRTALAVPGALVVSLLLGACGTQSAASGAGGEGEREDRCGTGASASGDAGAGGSGQGRDGVRIVGMVERADGAGASASPGVRAGERPDVSVTADSLPGLPGRGESPGAGGASSCVVAYSVTNQEAEPFTYTIVFSLLDDQGRAMSNAEETVASVGAGRTVQRTLENGGLLGSPRLDAERVRILDVKRVPSDEAPAPAGSCPPSGLRLTADKGDAAMGLRVVGLHLENCGSRPYSLEGYPVLQLLDEELEPVDGIDVLRGTDDIPMAGGDGPPRPVTLRPGESAVSGLAWRNTTQAGAAVTVPYVRVRAESGSDPVIVTPNLDLGTTGKLGVRAWQKDETEPGTGTVTEDGRPRS